MHCASLGVRNTRDRKSQVPGGKFLVPNNAREIKNLSRWTFVESYGCFGDESGSFSNKSALGDSSRVI